MFTWLFDLILAIFRMLAYPWLRLMLLDTPAVTLDWGFDSLNDN